jgi:hypothetical protein
MVEQEVTSFKKLSNFVIDFQDDDVENDRFYVETRNKNYMFLPVDEMASLLNGLLEIERLERQPGNRKCFAYSKRINDGRTSESKRLIGTRIGEKLNIRLLELDNRGRDLYQEARFDFTRDDVFDFVSYVLRTLHWYSEHASVYFGNLA